MENNNMSDLFHCDKLPFKLLVSGHNDIRYIDLENQQSSIFYNQHTSRRGISSYYGITWNKIGNTIFIIGTSREETNPKKTRNLLIALDLNGTFKKIINRTQFAQAHQIQYYDNKIFLCDTRHNRICIINPDNPENNKIYYPEPTNGPEIDISHFNSIYIHQDKVFIVAHNKYEPSQIYSADYVNGELINMQPFLKDIGEQCHNVIKYKNHLLICSSNKGCIINRMDNFITTGWYPRGMIIHNDLLFVGKSRIACKKWRSELDGEIEIFSLSTKHRLGYIQIPRIGQVYEIRCLNQYDVAHPVAPIW